MTAIGGMAAAGPAGLAAAQARVATIRSRIGVLTGGDGVSATARRADVPGPSRNPAPSRTTPGPGPVVARPGSVIRSASITATAPSVSTASATVAGATGFATRLPAAGRAWADAIEGAATAAGIEPSLLAAVVQNESGFDPDARSHAGAIGLGQLMPTTAAALGVDPHDPHQNLDGAARYLREQLDRFGVVDLALAAYNAGPTRVAQAGGVPRIPETLTYVDRVTTSWEKIR